MAELDTSIPLGIKVPEYDPMGDAYKIAQIRNAQQTYQSNNLALEENRRKLQEQQGLRNLLASGVDILSPEGRKQTLMVAPNLGLATIKTAFEAEKADREARSSDLKYTQDMIGHHREILPLVTDENSYKVWRASAVKDLPKLAEAIPTEYSAENVKRLMANSAKMLENEVKSINVQNPDGTITEKFISIPKTGIGAPSEIYSSTNAPQGAVRTDEQGKQWLRIGGVEYPVAESSTPAAEAIKRTTPSNAATAGAPSGAAAGPQTFNSAAPNVPTMAQPRVPLSQAFDPVAYDRAVRGAEGTAKNPNSSAEGLYQFTKGTFVDMFKKTFPEAKGMSDSQILAMRGSTLPNGKTVEEILGPAFTAQNAQYLQSKSLPVNGATVYLAHFLGPQGAERLLKADPNTPVSQVVNQDAIDANKSILQGKTVGQVQQWAANLIDKKGGTIGTASGSLPAFSQPQAGPTFAQPGAIGGPVTGGGAVTTGGYVPPQIGLNALAPQQQPAQNALLQQNQPVATQITPYQMQINNAPAQPVAGVEPFKQAGAGTKAAAAYDEALARKRAETAATKSEQAQGAKEVLDLIGFKPDGSTRVDDLIKQSTSGPLQSLGAGGARALGYATPGQQALAQLKTLSDSLTVQLLGGKLGAGISEGDRQAITRSLGNISDENQPASARLASWNEAKRRLAQVAGIDLPNMPAQNATLGRARPPAGKSAYSDLSDAEIKSKLGL